MNSDKDKEKRLSCSEKDGLLSTLNWTIEEGCVRNPMHGVFVCSAIGEAAGDLQYCKRLGLVERAAACIYVGLLECSCKIV